MVIGGTVANKQLKKILIAEDESDIQAILQLALEDVGQFTVRFCSSGSEALIAVESFEPDLILLDMMMPGLDGITTLSELRKLENHQKTPVVFVTAKAQPSEIEYYHQIGAIDVIIKPFDPMTLAEHLKTIWKLT